MLAAPKHVTEDIQWTFRPGRTPKYECEFAVHVRLPQDPQSRAVGRIVATSDRYRTKCAFIYSGVCIRRWESAGPHRNPDGEVIPGAHKHGWDETHEDRWAYVPDDIDTTSRDSILDSFMVECGIRIERTERSESEPSGIEGDA